MKRFHVVALGDLVDYGYHPFSEVAEVFHKELTGEGMAVNCTGDRDALREEALAGADVVVSYLDAWDQKLTDAQMTGLLRFVEEGGGFVAVHCGISPANPDYRALIGGRFVEHPPICTVPIRVADPDHPIGRELADFDLEEELYMFDLIEPDDRSVFLSTVWEGRTLPFAWTRIQGKGRIVYFAPGHTAETFRHPMAMKAVIEAVKWAGKSTQLP